jgi:threonine dehydrogenase-like Zn-dependent dehydrogenase
MAPSPGNCESAATQIERKSEIWYDIIRLNLLVCDGSEFHDGENFVQSWHRILLQADLCLPMKAIQFVAPGSMELISTGIPEPDPGWARVHVRAAAICRTDFEVLAGTFGLPYPIVPGHEWSGVVDATGSASDAAWIGRRVTGDNELSCLRCDHCRRGEWRQCAEYRQIGFQAPGAYAEYLLVPVHNLHSLPETVSFEQAALLEPLGVGVAVAKLAGARLGASGLVLGTGPIGLNSLAALKASGVSRILCVDLRTHRLELACSWGAAATCASSEELKEAATSWFPEGSDIVVDTTGNEQMIRLGISLTRFGGSFVLAGYCGGHSVPIVLDDVHLRNVHLIGAGNNAGFTKIAARCAEDGCLSTADMITHRYSLDDYRSALSLATLSGPDYIKGVFLP